MINPRVLSSIGLLLCCGMAHPAWAGWTQTSMIEVGSTHIQLKSFQDSVGLRAEITTAGGEKNAAVAILKDKAAVICPSPSNQKIIPICMKMAKPPVLGQWGAHLSELKIQPKRSSQTIAGHRCADYDFEITQFKGPASSPDSKIEKAKGTICASQVTGVGEWLFKFTGIEEKDLSKNPAVYQSFLKLKKLGLPLEIRSEVQESEKGNKAAGSVKTFHLKTVSLVESKLAPELFSAPAGFTVIDMPEAATNFLGSTLGK